MGEINHMLAIGIERGASAWQQALGSRILCRFVPGWRQRLEGPPDPKPFNGFCVTWTAHPTTGASNCTISIWFNFLSTDFSHFKGVKDTPVWLCAKTQLASSDVEVPGMERDVEVCHCQVKLFRDHGVESHFPYENDNWKTQTTNRPSLFD